MLDLDLQQALGASANYSCQKITLYIATRDRDNNLIPNVDAIIELAMGLLLEINLGVTRMPTSRGGWIDRRVATQMESDRPDLGRKSFAQSATWDDVVILYSYVRDSQRFIENIGRLRKFLHKYGQETNQGEVLVEYTGEGASIGDDTVGSFSYSRIYGIEKYDSEVSHNNLA